MNEIIEITEDNQELLEQEGLTLVDFWAEWCGPCRSMKPILEAFASKHPEVSVVKVNIDNHEELANKFNIRAIPTFIILKNKNTLVSKTGVISLDKMEELIES